MKYHNEENSWQSNQTPSWGKRSENHGRPQQPAVKAIKKGVHNTTRIDHALKGKTGYGYGMENE